MMAEAGRLVNRLKKFWRISVTDALTLPQTASKNNARNRPRCFMDKSFRGISVVP
jgi:hypothetical protein